MGAIIIYLSGHVFSDILRHYAGPKTVGIGLPNDTRVRWAEYDREAGRFRIIVESAAFPEEEVAR